MELCSETNGGINDECITSPDSYDGYLTVEEIGEEFITGSFEFTPLPPDPDDLFADLRNHTTTVKGI
jgi:hypothetical protein